MLPYMQGPRAVYGVPLEPNEKVLYFHRVASRIGLRIGFFFLGLLLIPAFGLGLLLIYGAFADRGQAVYCQVITNRRLLAINGEGKPKWEIRWEAVRGLNKVTGRKYEFGVRNEGGRQFMYDVDVPTIEPLIKGLMENPMLREQNPEVPFNPTVD